MPTEELLARLAELEAHAQLLAAPQDLPAARKDLIRLQELVAQLRKNLDQPTSGTAAASAALASEAAALQGSLEAALAGPRDELARKLRDDLASIGAQLSALVLRLGAEAQRAQRAERAERAERVECSAATAAAPRSGAWVGGGDAEEARQREPVRLQLSGQLLEWEADWDGSRALSSEETRRLAALCSEAAMIASAHREVLGLVASHAETIEGVVEATADAADCSANAIQELGAAAKTRVSGWRIRGQLGGAAVGGVVGAVVAGPLGAAIGAGAAGFGAGFAGRAAERQHSRRVDRVVAAAVSSSRTAAS